MYYSEDNVLMAQKALSIQPNNFYDVVSTNATHSFITDKLSFYIDIRSLSYFLKDIAIDRFSTNGVCTKLDQWAQVMRKMGEKEILQSDFIWGLSQAATTNSVEPLLYGETSALAINALFTQDLSALSLFRYHHEQVVRVSAAMNEYPRDLLKQ